MSNNNNHTHTFFALFTIFCAGLGGILYGYDIGVISGALLFVKETIPMSDGQMGIIVGGMLTGSLVGTIFAGPLADRYGRRTMILVACTIFIFGIAATVLATSFYSLLIGRLLLGVGVGIIAVAVPLYLTEIAPADIRGRSMTIFQLLLTFGIVTAYFVDLLFTQSGNWRGMFAVLLIPSIILFLSMLILPETPRWLLSMCREDATRKVLAKTRISSEVENEFQQIKESLLQTETGWRTLFSGVFLLPLFVSLAIAILNQLTGINVLLQYAPILIQQSGLHSHFMTMVETVGIGTINFLGTILSFFLVDRFGRRGLLITGTAGIVVAYAYLGLLPHLVTASETQALLSLIGFFAFILFFAIGPGVVVWLAISELLPTKVRGKAVTLSLFFNSLAASILSTTFLYIKSALGMANTYWLFAAFTLLYFLIALFLLPETKNKSLEEIQRFYQNRFAK